MKYIIYFALSVILITGVMIIAGDYPKLGSFILGSYTPLLIGIIRMTE